MIKCPACKNKYSYGRFLIHNCKDNSICFGKTFEKEQKLHNWNCNYPKESNNNKFHEKIISSMYIFE